MYLGCKVNSMAHTSHSSLVEHCGLFLCVCVGHFLLWLIYTVQYIVFPGLSSRWTMKLKPNRWFDCPTWSPVNDNTYSYPLFLWQAWIENNSRATAVRKLSLYLCRQCKFRVRSQQHWQIKWFRAQQYDILLEVTNQTIFVLFHQDMAG